jgi:SAM-dependent methyltransferase
MGIHGTAARGFASSAEAYERGRPGYPEAGVDWLRERLGLRSGTTVVDVAAGTGKLSRPLAGTGAEVIAVEPVAEMRALIGPPVRALEGTAEDLPLSDASTDAITVAQAFHWFAGEAALAEFHRVLRPGGALALVWNRRVLDDPVQTALDELFAPYRGDVPSHRGEHWRPPLESSRLFGPIEERDFPSAQVLDADLLADRVGSTSFIASLPDSEREGVIARVRALAGDGEVTLPYVTEVLVCDRQRQSGILARPSRPF